MKLDLKEWLAKVTGQTEFKTLLWSNPSPTVAFSAQEILLDLSQYEAVDVVICDYAPDASRRLNQFTGRVRKGTWSRIMANYQPGNYSDRYTRMEADRIAFGSGANQGGINDGNAVPLYIYGIRYVGGVVRKLLKALKPLTLGRGWAV